MCGLTITVLVRRAGPISCLGWTGLSRCLLWLVIGRRMCRKVCVCVCVTLLYGLLLLLGLCGVRRLFVYRIGRFGVVRAFVKGGGVT